MVTPILTPQEMDDIGQELYEAGLYPSSCVIQQPASGVDLTGAPLDGWTTSATVACRVDPPSRQPVEATGGGRLGPIVDYDVYLYPRDTAIDGNARILVNGRTLQVIADQDAVSISFDLKVSTKVVEA